MLHLPIKYTKYSSFNWSLRDAARKQHKPSRSSKLIIMPKKTLECSTNKARPKLVLVPRKDARVNQKPMNQVSVNSCVHQDQWQCTRLRGRLRS